MNKYSLIWFATILISLLASICCPSQAQENEGTEAERREQEVTALYNQGRYAEAIPIAEEVLAMCEKAPGPEHPDVAAILNSLALLYNNLGEYAKAEPLYQRALGINEKALGADHPRVATSLNNLASVYCDLGEYAKAEPLLKRALAINEKALGPEHPEVATTINNLALLYQNLGDYAKAEPLFQHALAINEKALGPEHPSVAMSLDNLAVLYRMRSEYVKAKPLHQRALAIREKALGPEHQYVAASLNNLAELYNNLGDYAKAEPLFQRALEINEKALGPEHPNVAGILDNLALLYSNLGDYAKAEPLLKRAVEINEKALGPEHPSVAVSLNNLGLLYHNLGDYAKAEPLYRRALSIREKAFGPDHPDVAFNINALGLLYSKLGDYAKAEALLKRAVEINEKALGLEHPGVAINISSLGLLYSDLGDYAKAEPLFQRALEINERARGAGHPNVALDLNNLGLLYRNLGDYAKAESLFQRALDINEKALGPEHPYVAHDRNNLALVYFDLGDYAKAEPLLKRALEIYEKVLGLEHPQVATSLDNLAFLYATGRNFDQAHALSMRAQRIEEKLIKEVVGFRSEDRQMKFLATRQYAFNASISLVATYMISDSNSRKDSLNLWLRRKGVLLEAQRRFQEALVYSDAPEALNTFQELARVRARLSEMTFGGPGKEGPEAYRKRISELESRETDLEAKLSRLSQVYALRKKIERSDTMKVAQALPEKTALIEFARIDMFNFDAKGKEEKWLPAHYLAFVVHSGEGEKIAMIDLGDAEKIDAEVAKFKELLPDPRDIRGAKAQESSRKLYELVFAPIKKELGATKEIFISPDGNLNLIPFEVLSGPDERFLIEDYSFNYLAAGRDLLGFGGSKGQGGKALLMGDPDFDLGADEKESTLRELTVRASGEREGQRRSSDMRGLHFARLPATREEVTAIAALLGPEKSEIYLGKEALEEILMRNQTPTILHLATHGFLLKDVELGGVSGLALDRGITEAFAILNKPSGGPGKIENPLLRSGIVLAGANRVISSEATDKSDGIVTAEKILGLKLRGTDMVVLSACETGLGEVKVGEGVYGLRRAFAQAGAKSLVMSMWAVPDKETKELMTEFYRKVIAGKMSRCQALRQAALAQMKIVKERYGYSNLFYWGAFIFMGEP